MHVSEGTVALKRRRTHSAGDRRLGEFLCRATELLERLVEQLESEFGEGVDEILEKHPPTKPLAVVDRGRHGYSFHRFPIARRKKLSDREREIAVLVIQGLSNQEIATQLDVENSTIASHLRQIFSKLNVSSRYELMRRAWVDGLHPDGAEDR